VSPHLLVVVHESHAGLGRLGEVGGARIDERRPDLGHTLPADLSGHDGLIVLGGSMAAWEDDVAPWLSQTRRLLAAAVERSVPTLAICLGAQLLALATGGTVERGAAGLEVGLVDIALTGAAAEDALMAPVSARFGDRFAVPHWHQDAITRLPAGAVLLATGGRYPNQAYRIGEAAWGLQYHPEVSAVDWRDWMEDGHGAVRTEGLHPEEVTAAMTGAEAHLVALAEAHAAAFAQVLAAR
jgi:GMP synthase-like glutamine amidotransferase